MAMAYSRLNQSELARTELQRCRQEIESEFAKEPSAKRNELNHWGDWLYNLCLLFEANALIKEGVQLRAGDRVPGLSNAVRQLKPNSAAAEERRSGSIRNSTLPAEDRQAIPDQDSNRINQIRSRAVAAATQQRWDTAATEYAQAIDMSQDDSWWNSPRKKLCRELCEWPEVFVRIAKLRPQETTLWIGRGQYSAAAVSLECRGSRLCQSDQFTACGG